MDTPPLTDCQIDDIMKKLQESSRIRLVEVHEMLNKVRELPLLCEILTLPNEICEQLFHIPNNTVWGVKKLGDAFCQCQLLNMVMVLKMDKDGTFYIGCSNGFSTPNGLGMSDVMDIIRLKKLAFQFYVDNNLDRSDDVMLLKEYEEMNVYMVDDIRKKYGFEDDATDKIIMLTTKQRFMINTINEHKGQTYEQMIDYSTIDDDIVLEGLIELGVIRIENHDTGAIDPDQRYTVLDKY